jgi:phosphoesterase RecJ-like protein
MKRYIAGEYEQQLLSAGKFIAVNDDFLVVAHIQPDGDAVASTAAMGWILHQMGKSYTLINESAIPEKFKFLPGVGDCVDGSEQPPSRSFQRIIALDCADFSRIGTVAASFAADSLLLNIDHHPTNDRYGTNQLIKPDASATVEILYDLALMLDLKLDADFANLIYAGLLTDTGGFRYSSTTSKVLRMAAKLLELGAEGPELADKLLERLTFEQVSLLQKGLSTLSFSFDHRIAWIVATSEMMEEVGASGEDLDGLINYPRNVEGVEVGILLKQRGPDEFKVSLRSAGRVDVAAIAKLFGGGGHVRAAGCSMNGQVDGILQQLIEEVGKQLK